MLKIGITGGIGVGKSVVCLIFAQLGIPVYDADSRAKQITTTDPALMAQVKTHFGEEAYTNGQLNRAWLAGQVFNNPDKLALLNSLVHPAVARDFENWVQQHARQAPYLLKEAALLFESQSYRQLDKIIVVSAPLALRIQRVLLRDPQRSPQEIEAIIAKQMPQEEKEKLADFVIYNDGQQPLIPQVLALHRQLLVLPNK